MLARKASRKCFARIIKSLEKSFLYHLFNSYNSFDLSNKYLSLLKFIKILSIFFMAKSINKIVCSNETSSLYDLNNILCRGVKPVALRKTTPSQKKVAAGIVLETYKNDPLFNDRTCASMGKHASIVEKTKHGGAARDRSKDRKAFDRSGTGLDRKKVVFISLFSDWFDWSDILAIHS